MLDKSNDSSPKPENPTPSTPSTPTPAPSEWPTVPVSPSEDLSKGQKP